MQPKIYNIKEPLNLERLRLAKPVNKNGSHFIKTLDLDNPIYFLCPKCFSKNGFIKSGKKIFCDLVFSNEDSDFLSWLENLEEKSRSNIYDNRESWFETPLDEHDIESSMSSPYKPYKSGKYFIVRVNVPTVLDKINIKIYDESEKETSPENIKENTKILAVLEFQGIRCSVRSFQFEIELKQLLIVEPEKLFEKCIIGSSLKDTVSENKSTSSLSEDYNKDPAKNENVIVLKNHENKDNKITLIKETHSEHETQELQDSTTHQNTEEKTQHEEYLKHTQIENGTNVDEHSDNSPSIGVQSSMLETLTDESLNVPIEINDNDFPLEHIANSNAENEPPLKLKSRNDVYYKLYKEMRQRAKEAKREALANYLEAKRIKNTHFLEDLSDSESDDDLRSG